jgi:hypothetical protein
MSEAYFGIKRADHILEEVRAAVVQWPKFAAETDIPETEIKYINNNLRVELN